MSATARLRVSLRWAIVFTALAAASLARDVAQFNGSGVPALDPAERQRVLDAVVENLRKHYFDPAIANRTIQSLRTRQRHGEYAAQNGPALAELLTRDMRDASHDMHLEVVYSQDLLPNQPVRPSPEALDGERRRLEQNNCMISKVEILPGNIGYFKSDFFPDRDICSGKFAAAMSALDRADAVIFDLRENRGGFPETVMLVASYFFDHPEYMFNPREAPSRNSWTRSPVEGSHLAGKRLYILTSSRTLSGAEQFCYNMKKLKRATLVGETTGGGAHAGVFHRIDDHFGVAIPEVRAINPYSDRDWEGVGVEPDVKVKAPDALDSAKKIAASDLHK